jgi:predicted dehydrogenase
MTLSVGFLGYGFMGRAHANALARLPMFVPEAPAVERAVLVGRDESALPAAADRLGFAATTTDWRDAVETVDVLYNLAPNHLHADPCVAALERGVHVLCEKPLAATLEGAERMAAAARESDAVAGVGFNYRFLPAVRYARRLVAAGDLGDVRQVQGSYRQDWLVDPAAPWSWRNDAEMAGSGALGDLGAHTIDLARYLVGDRVGEVDAVSGHCRTFVEERPVEDGARTRPVTVDDAFSAQVSYERGATGTFEASRVAAGHENDQTIAVHGSTGSVRFSLERLNELEVYRTGDRGYERVLVTGDDDPYGDRWWPPGHVLGWEHAFVHESAAFLGAVAGDGSFAPSFQDGLAVQRVLDAVQRSDERGERVAL